jgi:hypothetical protein
MSDSKSLSHAEMLARTTPEVIGGRLTPDSPEEREALERFARFFSDMTPERVRNEIDAVYAADAILHDTLATHLGLAAIKPYFLKTAERAGGVRVTIDQTIREDYDYYIRWTMDITWSAFRKGETTRSVGMSQLRFDAEGRVVLHHDFWDSTSGFFQYLPLLGPLIRWIKRKVA